MLTGVIRPVESRTVDVQVDDLTTLQETLQAQTPDGWDIVSLPQRTIARRDGLQEIEADDMTTLIGKVPDGWQLLYVRRV